MNENETNETPDVDETRPLGAYDESPTDESRTAETRTAETHAVETEDRSVPLTTMLTGDGAEEPDDRRTHPLSVGHLVCGLVFLGIAASWGLRQLGVIDSNGEQWVLPLVLVVAGGAGLLALVSKGMFSSKA